MILLTASLGGMSYLSFSNGLLLAYFSHLGIHSTTILILLSLLPISQFVFTIPFSYISDLFGKKLIGNLGMILSIFGFLLLIITSFFTQYYRTWIVGLGIVVFGTGSAMTIGNWFALLQPIIPEKLRGRFFGRLRLTWQSVGILFTLLVIYILDHYPTMGMHQTLIGIITFLMVVRMIFYHKIPELEKIFSALSIP